MLNIEARRLILGAEMPVAFSAGSVEDLEGRSTMSPFGSVEVTSVETDGTTTRIWVALPIVSVGKSALIGFSRARLNVGDRDLPMTGTTTQVGGQGLERGALFQGFGEGRARLSLNTWTFARQQPLQTLLPLRSCSVEAQL
jgi:hypothetical protein